MTLKHLNDEEGLGRIWITKKFLCIAESRRIGTYCGWCIISVIHVSDKRSQCVGWDGKGVGNGLENCFQELPKKRPSSPISWNRGRLETRLSKHGHYWTQFWGCRCWGISVGKGSMWAGARCLKVCTCKRDRASAWLLWIPGMCLALKRTTTTTTTTSFITKRKVKDYNNL